MGSKENRSVAVKVALLTSCFALMLMTAQNMLLNSQIATLQQQLKMSADQSPNKLQDEFLDAATTTQGIRNPRRKLLELPEAGPIDIDESVSQEEKVVFHRRRLSKGSSKGKGGSKSGKSSKKSTDCSSSRTNDSAFSSDAAQAQCEDLRQLVFDLSTEVRDLESETLRYNALADELQQTAIVAGGDVANSGRKLQVDFEYTGQLEDSLRLLRNQESLLKNGNERVAQLNILLRDSASGWLNRNADLSDENLALWQNVSFLTQENLELLNSQTRLNDQIATLNSTLNNYQDLLDSHSDLNGELNQTTFFLEAEIDRLIKANEEFQRLNNELSNEVDELKGQNAELANQNNILAGLNKDLNTTIDRLDNEVDNLSLEIDRLETQNGELTSEVSRLENVTSELKDVNEDLEQNVANLEEEVTEFSSTVDDLKKYNGELETIVSFVNETGSFLNETMNSVTEYLSEQIVAYRSVATETLQNTFIQRAALWDCAYRDHFGDDAFASNDKLPIPASKFDDVMSYVDDRVLSELCLSLSDFEDFLEEKFDDPIYTTNHIVSGIASYAYLAFDYYFPDASEEGKLGEEDWALAGYNCERLQPNKLFRFQGVV